MTTGNPRQLLQVILPFLILFGVFFLGFMTLKPFLPAILWALTLGISLAPLHLRLERHFGKRTWLATMAVTVLMVLFLLVPTVGLFRALVAFVPDALAWLDGLSVPQAGGESVDLKTDTLLGRDLELAWDTLRADVSVIQSYFGDDLKLFALWMLGEGRILGSFVAEFALGIVLAAILMHHQHAIRPFSRQFFQGVAGSFGTRMANHAGVTIRSTFLAVLLAAAAQSAVASVAYVVSGVPHWAILGALTFLLAMFQVGPVLVWGPIAIWLWMNGQPGMALFVCVWGIVAVGMTDNVVRSVLVARASDLPGILAFLGAIGGLFAWGIVGVFLGPVIVAVCYKLAKEWVNDPDGQEHAPD